MRVSPRGAPVGRGVRTLAILYVAVLFVVAAGEIGNLVRHEPLRALPISGAVDTLLLACISGLFCHVAFTGRRPDGIFPWGGLRWPLAGLKNRRVLRSIRLRFRKHRGSGPA
jgi:hypothetical protein